MYAFAILRGVGADAKAALIFRFSDPDAALASLKAAGVNVLSGVDLFN